MTVAKARQGTAPPFPDLARMAHTDMGHPGTPLQSAASGYKQQRISSSEQAFMAPVPVRLLLIDPSGSDWGRLSGDSIPVVKRKSAEDADRNSGLRLR
jgi:hypothetical protein